MSKDGRALTSADSTDTFSGLVWPAAIYAQNFAPSDESTQSIYIVNIDGVTASDQRGADDPRLVGVFDKPLLSKASPRHVLYIVDLDKPTSAA
jgi:hypothetical protein